MLSAEDRDGKNGKLHTGLFGGNRNNAGVNGGIGSLKGVLKAEGEGRKGDTG